MSDMHNPENIYPDGPTSFERNTNENEIRRMRTAIGISWCMIGGGTLVTASGTAPEFVQAAVEGEGGAMLMHGTGGAFVLGLVAVSAVNLREYHRRLRQAQYNQHLQRIAEENGL